MSRSENLSETSINILSEGTRIEGKIQVDRVSRIHGVLVGEVRATDGSTLILSETGVIEGEIYADQLVVDGYVQGEIHAKTRVIVSRTGRVVGNIKTPSLQLEFGSYFEGRCQMEKEAASAITANPSPQPA